MAEWFTAQHRWALIRRYGLDGSKTPEEMAIEEACELSPEVRELWATRDKWSDRDEFSQLLWPMVLRVLGLAGDGGRQADVVGSSRRKPISRGTLELAVRLIVEKAGRNEVTRKTGLSKRLVDGLIADVDDGNITLNDRVGLGLPPGTRATSAGIVLPERR
jgi:hypothetical protein